MNGETHPLTPFLPQGAKVLILGSFPPPRKRWCMEFSIPIGPTTSGEYGAISPRETRNTLSCLAKTFRQGKDSCLCQAYGLALYDTAEEIVRLKDNASDKFLQVIRPTDIARLLEMLPECHAIVATGQKSADTLASVLGCAPLSVGECVETQCAGRAVKVWRMPSTSRAYPRSVEWKAEYYKRIFSDL